MRTSFHHQPEAQHPNFPLSTSWQADYPIFLRHSGREKLVKIRVLRFRLMVKRGLHLRPQASEGEAQHGLFCWTGCVGQGDERLHRG